MSEGEARRRFGNFGEKQEGSREVWISRWWWDFVQDLRYALVKQGLRLPVSAPGFTVVVLLALALAIGGNTVVFSVLNAVLFQPLPYPQPDKIVSIGMRFTDIGAANDRNWTSPPEFADLQRLSSSFSYIAGYATGSANLRAGDTPERFLGSYVTSDFFHVLGVGAMLGRTFTTEEGTPGKDKVIVLSHGLWQTRFGSDAGMIGRTLNVNGEPYTVVGVMPADFEDAARAGIWIPMAFTADQLSPNSRGSHFLSVLARIKPGMTFAQAEADAARVSKQIIDGAPQYPYRDVNFAVMLFPLLEDTVGDIKPALWLMMGAVVLVLLIACANVANLMLVRASAREKEIAVRAALGASRTRLVRQLLTESIVLSLGGAALGLILARFGIAALANAAGEAFPRLAGAGLDWTTLGYTTAVAVATGLFFGIAPALQVSQFRTHESLRDGGRSNTAGGHAQRIRRVLVVAEVALSLALLTGAGLLIKSFLRLQAVDPGFQTDNVLTFRVVLPNARYAEPGPRRTFYRNLLERVRATPGVVSAGAINALPLSGSGGSGTTTMDTTAVPPDEASVEADRRVVTPDYFEVVGTRLLRGRFFTEHDNEGGQPVAIVDETLAAAYWPKEDAIGKRLKLGGQMSTQPWRTVVGVVQHTRYLTLEAPSRVEVYVPYEQSPSGGMSLAIKTAANPAGLIPTMRQLVTELDPDQPIYAAQPFAVLMASSLLRRELVMFLLAGFAGIALTLAAVGVYGLLSYWVAQRSHEIGIRVALGASRGQVLSMVTGQSVAIVAVGVVVGLAAAFGVTRMLSAMLFDVKATDVPTFAIVSGALLLVGLVASFVPAWRATRVDPIETLR